VYFKGVFVTSLNIREFLQKLKSNIISSILKHLSSIGINRSCDFRVTYAKALLQQKLEEKKKNIKKL